MTSQTGVSASAVSKCLLMAEEPLSPSKRTRGETGGPEKGEGEAKRRRQGGEGAAGLPSAAVCAGEESLCCRSGCCLSEEGTDNRGARRLPNLDWSTKTSKQRRFFGKQRNTIPVCPNHLTGSIRMVFELRPYRDPLLLVLYHPALISHPCNIFVYYRHKTRF